MTGRLRQLAERREQLVAVAGSQRASLEAVTADVRREIAVFEGVLGFVRGVGRHPVLVAAAAGVLGFLAPRALRRSLPWIMGIAPIAVEAYRFVRALRRQSSV